MYLSRIELDAKRRETMSALSFPNIIHGAVERSVSGERTRKLWRIDRLENRYYLLILSAEQPVLTGIAEQLGFCGRAGETRLYDNVLTALESGQRLRFRLRANPIHSAAPPSRGERGAVHAHVTAEQQRQWLIAKGQKHGFKLEPESFDIVDSRWYRFAKHHGAKDSVIIHTVTFEGVLTVTDEALFREALTSGIGKAKAYGCGLLTVMHT